MFLPGEFHGQRSLAGYSPWGHKETDKTERLTRTDMGPQARQRGAKSSASRAGPTASEAVLITDLIHSLMYWFSQQILTKHGHVSVLDRDQDPLEHQIGTCLRGCQSSTGALSIRSQKTAAETGSARCELTGQELTLLCAGS